MSMSQVIIIGHLGVTPELRYTKNSTAVLTLSIGVSEKLKPTDPKEKQPKTFWHKCRLWGNYASSMAPQLKKGDKIFVKGTLIYDAWEDKAGRHHKDAIVEVETLEKMYFENITIDMGDGKTLNDHLHRSL
jgi:single-strand DNA-binding protein